MENASKALIIAGAILLSILLISLGIMVYTNAKGSIGEANLNSEEIQTFNTKISQYCGKNKSADEINGLVSTIAASNGTQSKFSDKHYVGITVSCDSKYFTGSKSITTVDYSSATGAEELKKDSLVNGSSFSYPNFSEGKKYTATYETDNAGYICKVTIN